MAVRLPISGILLALFLSAAAPAQEKTLPSAYHELVNRAASGRGLEVETLMTQAAQLHAATTGVDAYRARVAVQRDVAEVLAGRGAWVEALNHAGVAVTSAQYLGDAPALLELQLRRAAYADQAGDILQGFDAVNRADTLLAGVPDRAASARSALVRASLLSRDRRRQDEMEAIYTRLLQDAGANRLRIELARARHTRLDRLPLHPERWAVVRELARAANERKIEAEAHDQLGAAATSRADFPLAAQHFTAAEDLGVPLERGVALWLDIVRAYSATARRAQARQALARAETLVDQNAEPGRAAVLHEAASELLAQEGDMVGAYGELRLAGEFNRRARDRPTSIPITRLVGTPSAAASNHAAELAAVRHALRDAELDRTRLRARQTAGLAAVAVLATALLGLAYAYKRRAATALATARDNAELRADRTHWQMLRYQLNPHFLFNALSSLGGLVATDPRAAGRVVDRLSEFCQLALKGSTEDLRTLERELEIIRAYLDVEQAGAGETLAVRFDTTPAALSCIVPPLLLQPLVENALKYGGETSDEHLEVVISARRSAEGASLELEVANTGRWVERPAESRPRAAVGLGNVRERLARFGGDAASLTFAHDGGWVRARLRLPVRETAPEPSAP